MPFVKGQSGNPKGRPQIPDSMATLTREILSAKKNGKTRAERIINKIAQLAEESGSVVHAQFLFERGYGKVKDVIENLTPVDDPESKAVRDLVRNNPAFKKAFLAAMKKNGE